MQSLARKMTCEELIQLEDSWNRKININDVDAIGRFMADDWCLIDDAGGIMIESPFLGMIDPGDVTHDATEGKYATARMFGVTAVVATMAKSGVERTRDRRLPSMSDRQASTAVSTVLGYACSPSSPQ